MLTKNQRLIYALAGLKTIIGDYEFETKVKDNETGEVDIVDCYKEIETLIVEFINPQPYKFEDLKVGIWVWDDKNEMFILITFIDKQFKKMHVCLTEYDGFNDEYVNVEYTEYFEESRFFPITKALEYQE